jgi:hypothetical protein
LTISTGHTNDGQKAKVETRQNSSLRSQSLTSLGLTPSANDPEYLGLKEIEFVEDRYRTERAWPPSGSPLEVG